VDDGGLTKCEIFPVHAAASAEEACDLVRRLVCEFILPRDSIAAEASSGTRRRTSGLASPASPASCSKSFGVTLSDEYSRPIRIAMLVVEKDFA
jgi:hypothetical protein